MRVYDAIEYIYANLCRVTTWNLELVIKWRLNISLLLFHFWAVVWRDQKPIHVKLGIGTVIKKVRVSFWIYCVICDLWVNWVYGKNRTCDYRTPYQIKSHSFFCSPFWHRFKSLFFSISLSLFAHRFSSISQFSWFGSFMLEQTLVDYLKCFIESVEWLQCTSIVTWFVWHLFYDVVIVIVL